MKLCFGVVVVAVLVDFACAIFVIEANTTSASRRRAAQQHKLTPAEWTEAGDEGLWSSILEDWTLGQSTSREGRVFRPSHRYIPTSGFYITKRIGEAQPVTQSPTMELEPHLRPPGKVISQPMGGGPAAGSQQTLRQNFGNVSPSPREVSETDLYLLGAIEKLVYRVDYMEKRLRRTEQMIYYLMAGNNQKEVSDPCPDNFTRVGKNCYHFGTQRDLNWKSSSTMCKSLGGHLAEFESVEESRDMIAFLLNHQQHRGKDFWLGGLNPGLLWIWTNSAKPVNPNTNLTSISSSASSAATTQSANATATKINSTKTTTTSPKAATTTENPKKLPTTASGGSGKQSFEIKGSGRCLRFSYNPALHTYGYTGQDCNGRYNYLCEIEDRTLDNEISRIAKELNLPN